jgi:hypothetical protein
MRSIGPYGWANHGFFGFFAKTFGNPKGGVPGTSGITFTHRQNPTGHSIFALANNGAGLSMLVDSTGAVWTSGNGQTFTQDIGQVITPFAPLAPRGSLIYVPASGTWFLSAAEGLSGGDQVFRSTNDGESWIATAAGITNGGFLALTQGPADSLVAVGNTVPAPPANYGHSANGTIWTKNGVTTISGPAGSLPQALLYDGTDFQLFSINAAGTIASIWTSADGLTWTATEMDFTEPDESLGVGLFVGGNYYCADTGAVQVFGPAASIATLAGEVGTPIPTTGFAQFLAYNGTNFFAFDAHGTVANSPDFVNWALGSLNMEAGESANAVTYDANHNSLIVGGTDGSICTVP